MKKILVLAIVLIMMFSITAIIMILINDSKSKDKVDLSKVSFIMTIDNFHMTKNFGIYGEIENEVGIVVYGNVEKGKVHEYSRLIFVDDNGNVLYDDTVFKIEIVEFSSTSSSAKSQSFAEKGDGAAMYFRAGKDDIDAYDSKYVKTLDLIGKSKFAVLE